MSQDLPTVLNVFKNGCNSEKNGITSKFDKNSKFNLEDITPSEGEEGSQYLFADFYDEQMYNLQKKISYQRSRSSRRRRKSIDFHEFTIDTLNHIIRERNSRSKNQSK